MNIKQLTEEDWSAWKQLRLEAVQDVPEAFGSSYEEEKDYSETDWKASLSKSDVFGAFVEGNLAGAVGFFKLNQLKTKHRGVLFGMYTKREYRGNNIGHKLVETLIHHSRDCISQLHLTCVTSNDLALKFYKKFGFEIYGTEPRSLKIDETYFDEHLMVLDLR